MAFSENDNGWFNKVFFKYIYIYIYIEDEDKSLFGN